MKLKSYLIFIIFLVITLLFYIDSFSHFFYQDDFFHFYISQAHSIREFIDFFNPINKFSYQIYRPLSTQVFFFLYQKIFGFNHFIFQFIVLLLLSLNCFLLFKIISKYINHNLAFLLAIFYLFHHQNIGIAYYLSTIQTSFVVLLTLLSLLAIQQKRQNWQIKVFLFYFLSLFCHEIIIFNSFIYIFILLLEDLNNLKKEKKLIIALSSMTILFIIFRLYFVNNQFFQNTHYSLSFSPKTIMNNLMWYIFWFLSVPEYVINFVGSGFKPLPPLFNQYLRESMFSLIFLFVNLVIFSFLILKSKFNQKIILYFAFFIISLLPVLLFPWHKYVYYLPVASIFVIIALSLIIKKNHNSKVYYLIFSLLLITAFATNFVDRKTSYNFKRGRFAAIMRQQLDFSLLKNGNKKILLANDPSFQVFSKDWGSTSSQAKIVLRDDIGIKLLSQNPHLMIYYEDDANFDKNMDFDYYFIIKKEWQ
ncbi:hypothetical protein GYA19_03095 [Candidatus Beckwithbacteria bacterium]|nr:hypothetical protein [Candidatus Beckwithbacteria bacterium]